MAVKATKVEETGLSVTGAVPGFNPMASMVEPERAGFLPAIKLVHPKDSDVVLPILDDKGQPMVRDGKPLTQSATGYVVITSGKGKVVPFKAPYTMTAWCIRGATRRWDGQKYHRTFSSIKPGEVNKKHEEAMSKANTDGIMIGNVALVVVLTNDGKAAVGLLDMFNTSTKYWGEVLKNGMFFNGEGVTINIDDHTPNIAISAAGRKYYSYTKFNQWSQVKLTEDQTNLIRDTLKENMESCDAWLNKNE